MQNQNTKPKCHYPGCSEDCWYDSARRSYSPACGRGHLQLPSSFSSSVPNSGIINFYESNKPYYEFTNFYPAPITMFYKNSMYTFPTSEHYFQAKKYEHDFNWNKHLTVIISNPAPRSAFEYTRSHSYDYKAFDAIKDSVMYDAVYAKFTSHQNLQRLLKSTGNAILVEHTTNDSYWGDGGNGSGQNKLGKILMKVRSVI